MSENEPQYSSEEEAEAYKFNEMVDRGVVSRAEVSDVEKDKSPEEIEAEKAAMEKVMDINKEGTAYSAFRGEFDKNILTEGLLGLPWPEDKKVPYSQIINEGSIKHYWAESAKRIGRSVSFCNIVGRDIKSIEGAAWGFPGVVFDLSQFTEEDPIFLYDVYHRKFDKKMRFRSRTYRPYSDSVGERGYLSSRDEKGRYNPHSSDGFAISPRVSPIFFRGIIISDISTKNETLSIMKETYKGKSKLSIPLYDQKGNLLWPKKNDT